MKSVIFLNLFLFIFILFIRWSSEVVSIYFYFIFYHVNSVGFFLINLFSFLCFLSGEERFSFNLFLFFICNQVKGRLFFIYFCLLFIFLPSEKRTLLVFLIYVYFLIIFYLFFIFPIRRRAFFFEFLFYLCFIFLSSEERKFFLYLHLFIFICVFIRYRADFFFWMYFHLFLFFYQVTSGFFLNLFLVTFILLSGE